MTNFPDLFAALASPFASHEVKVRQQAGRQLHYISARVAQNRLDSVLGPENWWCDYQETRNGLMCRLTIRLPDGSTLTKCDGGAGAGMAEADNEEKSAFSDAFKRACVTFGIARYLYRDGVPDFCGDAPPPAESRPAPRQPAPPARNGDGHHAPPRQQQGGGDYGNPPRSGRALFAWTKEMEQKYEVGLLQYLNKWGKLQDLPGRMVDWDDEMVADAYQEAVRKLQGTARERDDEDRREPAVTNGCDQGDDCPFDPAPAWAALLGKAEAIARGIFGDHFDGSDQQHDAALRALDPAVPEHLRVDDWASCRDRAPFEAYWRAAIDYLKQQEDVPR